MTKQYIPGETKSQRRLRKEQERSKHTDADLSSTSSRRFVCCLKYGTKYSAEYVNKLYNMVQQHLTLDHEFVCFTEDPTGIDPQIRIEPLPGIPVSGWWFKPMFFNPQLCVNGTILFLDLDIVIFRNINCLFEFTPGKFCIIRDFNRYVIRNFNKFNSSVFRLTTGQFSNVYQEFVKDPKSVMRRFPGDQDWIRDQIKTDYVFWPDDWIQSYKWEMRNRPKFDNKNRGERDFEIPGDPTILENTSIAVFHGDPNPHNCKDPWVKENWR